MYCEREMRPTETPSVSLTAVHPSPEAGHGFIVVERLEGRSVPVRLRANSPLKLLTPRRRSEAAWIIAGSYGGGLVAGDTLQIEIHAGQDAKLFLGTQASTKIYRSTNAECCRQTLSLTAQAGAVCVVAPDPITPFSESIYQQKQHINLAADASLILVDWLTAGRSACNERWAFSRYESRTDIFVAGRQVLREALLLDSLDGSLDHVCRTGHFGCFATVILVGPAISEDAKALFDRITHSSVRRGADLYFAASPILGGLLIRVAGPGPEIVGRWLRSSLAFVGKLLGEDPWARTW